MCLPVVLFVCLKPTNCQTDEHDTENREPKTDIRYMDKNQKLAHLKKRMQDDMSLPLRDQATQLVFGEGNPEADLYFLGEAPGFHEDQQGRPFVGQAGKLLNKTLEEIGLKREDVYISNVVRFRPPANRDPLPEELAAFARYIDEEIEIINPKVIVTLGRFSMGKFIPDVKISQVHGVPRHVDWKGRQVLVVPMFHPAAALRAPAMMKMFEDDFKKLPKLLQKDTPKIEETKAETQAEDKPKSKQLELI
jgi:uracil-DNA glycosylase